MNKTIIVEGFRELLNDRGEALTDNAKYEQHVAIYKILESFLSIKEKFEIAKQLLKELEAYDTYYYDYNVTSFLEQWKSYFALLNSFHEYDGISRKEFALLLEEASLAVVALIIGNSIFPIDFLIEDSFLERHKSNFNYWVVESSMKTARQRRKSEIMAYYKSVVSGSEYMTDEMVLNVIGIRSLPS